MSAEADDGHGAARDIAAALLELPGVRAVALGGSRASGLASPASDLDLYVYADDEVAHAPRAALARALADPATAIELGNDTFGPGDEWTDAASGLGVDLMFWTCAWIEDQLDRVLVRHQASVGYSTAWWHNVLRSVPLAEQGDWYAGLLRRARQPYPEPLRRAVIARNHPLLRSARSSFSHQLDGALARGDAPAVLDRTAALLAAYSDVLFAVNRVPHPGEKRLAAWVARTCPLAPADLGARLAAVNTAIASGDGDLRAVLDGLIDDLDAILTAEDLLPRPDLLR